MNSKQTLVIPTDPVPKPRMTRSDKWKQRPCVMRYRAFCDELRLRMNGHTIDDTLDVAFYIPFPKSYSKKKRARMEGEPHRLRPDVDNLVKAVMDALMVEDCAVWKIQAEKRWSGNGRIEFYPQRKETP